MRSALRSVLAIGVVTAAGATTIGLTAAHGDAPSPFAGGPLVVYRVGDGTGALTGAAAPVFLDYYAADGQLDHSVALPTTTSGIQHRLTAAGYSASEGELTRSPDGHRVVLTGYDAATGTFGPAGDPQPLAATDPTSVARVIGLVDGNGTVDTSTVVGSASTPQVVRSATTTDGTRLWLTGGNGGVLSTRTGSTSAPVTVAGDGTSNLDELTVQGNQLFASGTAGAALSTVGTGTPAAAGSALTALPGLPAHTPSSGYALPYGYALFDLGVQSFAGTGLDTLYVVNAAERAGAVDKYHFNGTAWALAGSVNVPGAFGLAASADLATVSLAVSTPTGIETLVDPDGSDSAHFAPSSGPTLFASAPPNTAFRGIALAPTALGGPSVFIRTPDYDSNLAASAATLPVAADVTDTADGVDTVTAAVDSGTPVTLTHGTGSRWTGSVPAGALANGTHTLKVTATDGSAAHGTTTVTRTFTVGALVVPAGDIGPGKASFTDKRVKHSTGFAKTTFTGSPDGHGLKATGKATASFTYYGRTLTLHLGGRKNAGKITVVDAGKSHTIDLYRSSSKTITVTFGPHSLGAHKVTITAPKTKSSKSSGYLVLLGWLEVSK